jgi:small-conductance mechanosensitive channel/CRP-like cAMP-binding protein
MHWLRELTSHPLLGTFVCLATALLALVFRQLAHRGRLKRHLDASFSLIIIGLLCGSLGAVIRLAGWTAAARYLDAVLVGAVTIGSVRTALTLFVDLYLRQREGAVVSAIVRDVASIIAYFVVIVVVLRTTLNINLASLVATSAVLTAIIGLALQDLLSNLFSGLVLEMEAPFSSGDWVRVGTHEGIVQETGWRTTKLRTRVNELVTLPNALLSKEAVVNYSRPNPLYGDTLHIQTAYEAPPNLVQETVAAVFASDPGVALTPQTEVRLKSYNDSGIDYAIRYWTTDFGELERTRSRLLTNLWYALGRAQIRIPFPARDLFVYPGTAPMLAPEQPDLVHILRGIPLLAPLDAAALARLAARVHRLTYGRGEVVVRQGETGDSFYVIERGEAEVTLVANAVATPLGRLLPGGFFGEMSLLAGEPRSATVRAVSDLTLLMISHAAFRETVVADPTLLGHLSEIAAQRQAAQDASRRVTDGAPAAVEVQRTQLLRERIRAFLRL